MFSPNFRILLVIYKMTLLILLMILPDFRILLVIILIVSRILLIFPLSNRESISKVPVEVSGFTNDYPGFPDSVSNLPETPQILLMISPDHRIPLVISQVARTVPLVKDILYIRILIFELLILGIPCSLNPIP